MLIENAGFRKKKTMLMIAFFYLLIEHGTTCSFEKFLSAFMISYIFEYF